MKLSILSEAIHPRLKAAMTELNAELSKALASLNFKLDPDIELMYSANGFPAGWNVGTIDFDGNDYTIWANFDGQVGIATDRTPPNRWHTPEELITTIKRRTKKALNFKSKSAARRLLLMLKQYGQPDFGYYRPPVDPAKPAYGEGWYQSSDAPWMGRGVIEYVKSHNLTPEDLEKLKDSFCMTVIGWRWKKTQEKAGVILPDEPTKDGEFHVDDSFEHKQEQNLLVNKDAVALTTWQAKYHPTIVVTWWPPEIVEALRFMWQHAKDEFIAGIEKAKKE